MKLNKRFKIIGITLFILITLLLGIKIFLRHESVKCALEYGRLDDIPSNAKRIKVKTRGNPFSRKFFLSFQSTEDEINTWIKNAPDLVKKTWVNPNFKTSGKIKMLGINNENHGLYWPEWFNIEEINDGEYYEIPMNDEQLYGKVWIDKEQTIVYIETSHS